MPPTKPTPPALKAAPGAPGLAIGKPTERSCAVVVDDATDGGDWVLLWCYAHEGGTNPDLVSGKLPTSPDGFSHATVTHLGRELGVDLTAAHVKEVRFYAHSSGHERVIHFKSANRGLCELVAEKDGAQFNVAAGGAAQGWWTKKHRADGWTPLSGHTAHTPDAANGWWGSLSHYLYYEGGSRTWAIKGSGFRWEVDDHVAGKEGAGPRANAEGYDGMSRSTLHQVWVKFEEHAPITLRAAEGVADGMAKGGGKGLGETVLGWFSPAAAATSAPVVMGTVMGTAVGAASASAPPLVEMVNALKRELGIEGNVSEVVARACRELGVSTEGKNLTEQATECWVLVNGAN